MTDVRDLYQEAILDHYRKPRNFHRLEHANRQADGHNPLCGDKFTVFIQLEDGILKDIGFTGRGCAISMASGSMMTESLKGKTESEARAVFAGFHNLVTGPSSTLPNRSGMGKLAVFAGVREYPVRAKCATLIWETLWAALNGSNEIATTE